VLQDDRLDLGDPHRRGFRQDEDNGRSTPPPYPINSGTTCPPYTSGQ
jgi:hypothetical protein